MCVHAFDVLRALVAVLAAGQRLANAGGQRRGREEQHEGKGRGSCPTWPQEVGGG